MTIPNLKNKILFATALALFSAPLFVAIASEAQELEEVNKLANPIGGTYITKDGKPADDKTRRGDTDIYEMLSKIVKIALSILGSVTLLVFVAGGLMWLTSGGNEQRVQRGTKTMLYATIGIFVIFSAYAILSALFKVLTGE